MAGSSANTDCETEQKWLSSKAGSMAQSRIKAQASTAIHATLMTVWQGSKACPSRSTAANVRHTVCYHMRRLGHMRS